MNLSWDAGRAHTYIDAWCAANSAVYEPDSAWADGATLRFEATIKTLPLPERRIVITKLVADGDSA